MGSASTDSSELRRINRVFPVDQLNRLSGDAVWHPAIITSSAPDHWQEAACQLHAMPVTLAGYTQQILFLVVYADQPVAI